MVLIVRTGDGKYYFATWYTVVLLLKAVVVERIRFFCPMVHRRPGHYKGLTRIEAVRQGDLMTS